MHLQHATLAGNTSTDSAMVMSNTGEDGYLS